MFNVAASQGLVPIYLMVSRADWIGTHLLNGILRVTEATTLLIIPALLYIMIYEVFKLREHLWYLRLI